MLATGPSAMLRRKPSNAGDKEPGHRKVGAGSLCTAGVPAHPAMSEPGVPRSAEQEG